MGETKTLRRAMSVEEAERKKGVVSRAAGY